ncbi:MAG: hypothetical protein IJL31_00105 [Oscillospiraceae bacterium]|nr:hypothetical protein [Oscillospiraceae bacterium]MBQ6243201.1 hypothetical protein [Bacteroidales bacterium]
MKKISAFFKKLFGPRATKINLEYPISWETMSPEDFRQVCHILSLRGLDRERALFLCLCALAHIQPDDPSKYDARKIIGKMPFIIDGKSYIIGAADITEACNQLGFIFDGIGLPPSPFKQVDRKLFGISFDAFYTADSFIARAAADRNPGHLKEAVKVLTNGSKRKLLEWERQALVIWWNGVKDYLQKRYPYVFRKGESVTDKTQAEILQDLLACMNDNRPQENEKILKTEVHSVLYSLNKLYENAVKNVPR